MQNSTEQQQLEQTLPSQIKNQPWHDACIKDNKNKDSKKQNQNESHTLIKGGHHENHNSNQDPRHRQ
jgi:hypothetical protein